MYAVRYLTDERSERLATQNTLRMADEFSS